MREVAYRSCSLDQKRFATHKEITQQGHDRSVSRSVSEQLAFRPSKIRIEIEQAKFLAETYKNNKKYFIGSNGKLIDYKIFNFSKDIPNVFGNFTSKQFIELNKALKGVKTWSWYKPTITSILFFL